MKTIIMKDIIEKLADHGQLVALHDALTPAQYYDLMMNTGTTKRDDEDDPVGVLSQSNAHAKEYQKALTAHIGKTKKFWENANQLVLNINKEIRPDDRKDFHLVERVITDDLIKMLEKGVPENEAALNEVSEEVREETSLLNIFMRGNINKSSWIKVNIVTGSQKVPAYFGALVDDTCIHYQPASSLVIHILDEFRKARVKTLRFDRAFLDMYVEAPYYTGNLERELGKVTVMLATIGDGETRELCHSMFTNISTVRNEALDSMPRTCPDTLEITINEEAWVTLTSECKPA